MRSAWLLLAMGLAGVLGAGKWKCSRREVARAGGNVCCNSMVGKMMKKQMRRGPSKKSAVAIRKKLEKQEGGYWEVLVSKSDFGFANYMVQAFHCKVESRGKTAMAWKVLGGGASPPQSNEEEDSKEEQKKPKTGPKATPPEPSKSSEEETQTDAPATTRRPKPTTRKPRRKKKTPNEKLMECCLKGKVAPSCYDKSGGKANLCDFNEYTSSALINHYLQKTCPAGDMGKILLCASSDTGHNDCCASAGVDIPLCSVFCNAAVDGLRAPKPNEFSCAGKLNQIKGCFIRYMKYGSSYKRG